MKYDFKTKELIWGKLINDCAIEYCKFMKIEGLPNFKPKYIYNLDGINYSMMTLTYQRPIVLNINVGFMIDKHFDYKATLFHEFTHMLDSEIYLQNMPLSNKSKYLSLFTEFHATYIAGTYIIANKNCHDKLHEMIDKRVQLMNEAIISINSEKNPSNYDALVNSYMYYYGIITAHNDYFQPHIIPEKFDTIYDDNMQLYYNALKFLQIDERIFDLSLKMNELLDKKFIQSILK